MCLCNTTVCDHLWPLRNGHQRSGNCSKSFIIKIHQTHKNTIERNRAVINLKGRLRTPRDCGVRKMGDGTIKKLYHCKNRLNF